MPQIRFVKGQSPIDVEVGANLRQSLLRAGLPVASSCGGDGICAKCHIKILSGANNLSEESDFEVGLRERNNIDRGRRISCQTKVLGDITVDASYW